jgi:hypothetical protein
MPLAISRRVGTVAVVLAAVASSLLVPASPAAAQTGAATSATIFYWNDTLLELYRRQGGGPGPLARAAAIMHAGMFNAINTADWSQRGWTGQGVDWYGARPAPTGSYVNEDAAAGLVARELLFQAFPAHQPFIAQRFTARYGQSPPNDAVDLANRTVAEIRRLRNGDGSANFTPYQTSTTPGAWRPTAGGGCGNAVDPNWGAVRPFTMTSTTQFRQPLPGGFTSYPALLASSLYAQQVNEVQSLGRFNSTTRTALQTQIAWFWANDLDGTYKPPGQLLVHTQLVAQQRGITDPNRLARIFAQVSLAMADAGIASWDMKYLTPIDLWRPQTAIQLAASDGNPATNPDPAWLPLSATRTDERFSPCFPAWASGHATFGAAWAGVMRSEFGDNANNVVLTTEDPHAIGVTRTLPTFTAAAVENAESRIFLGVHYRFDATAGNAAGFGIGDRVHDTTFLPITL